MSEGARGARLSDTKVSRAAPESKGRADYISFIVPAPMRRPGEDPGHLSPGRTRIVAVRKQR